MNNKTKRFLSVKSVVSDSSEYDFQKIYQQYASEINDFSDDKFQRYLSDLKERYNDDVHNCYEKADKFMVLHNASDAHSNN